MNRMNGPKNNSIANRNSFVELVYFSSTPSSFFMVFLTKIAFTIAYGQKKGISCKEKAISLTFFKNSSRCSFTKRLVSSTLFRPFIQKIQWPLKTIITPFTTAIYIFLISTMISIWGGIKWVDFHISKPLFYSLSDVVTTILRGCWLPLMALCNLIFNTKAILFRKNTFTIQANAFFFHFCHMHCSRYVKTYWQIFAENVQKDLYHFFSAWSSDQ